MICWNYGRPDEDGSYSDSVKFGMISVIIHEIGHNFFPMIVNSDERQWGWMDEGLDTFMQYLTGKVCWHILTQLMVWKNILQEGESPKLLLITCLAIRAFWHLLCPTLRMFISWGPMPMENPQQLSIF